jgi:hypothetical protein
MTKLGRAKSVANKTHQAELDWLPHEKFCRAFVRGVTGTQAAIEAGYSAPSASVASSRLLKREEIQRRIATLREMHGLVPGKPAKVDRQWVMDSLVRNVEAALAANDRAAANRGLELLGREYGLFTEKRVVAQDPLDGLTAVELQRLLNLAGQAEAKTIEGSYGSLNSEPLLINDLSLGTDDDCTTVEPERPFGGVSAAMDGVDLTLPSLDLAVDPPAPGDGGGAPATAGGDLHTPPTGGSTDPTDPAENCEETPQWLRPSNSTCSLNSSQEPTP